MFSLPINNISSLVNEYSQFIFARLIQSMSSSSSSLTSLFSISFCSSYSLSFLFDSLLMSIPLLSFEFLQLTNILIGRSLNSYKFIFIDSSSNLFITILYILIVLSNVFNSIYNCDKGSIALSISIKLNPFSAK